MRSIPVHDSDRRSLRVLWLLGPLLLLGTAPLRSYAQRAPQHMADRAHEFDWLKLRQGASGSPPPSTHAPAPPSKSEVQCGIVHWTADSPLPVLTVICPPRPVFSPLHVYLQFTWKNAQDLPKDLERIVAEPGNLTKLVLRDPAARVWLRVRKKKSEEVKERWITFGVLRGLQLEGQ
jgi:hypothetical protein